MVTLAASGIPVRSAGRPPDGIDLPHVDMDNRDGGRQAAEHLLLGGRGPSVSSRGRPPCPRRGIGSTASCRRSPWPG
ncbi:hypothetical protein ACFQX6_36065 [Streptosporangium lutulentum]